jgi:hypothetical protein
MSCPSTYLLPKPSAKVILRGLRHWHEHQYANSRYVRCWRLRLNHERRKREAERENEPDHPHWHLDGGWLGRESSRRRLIEGLLMS